MSYYRWQECCWCCGDVVAYLIGIQIEMKMEMEMGLEIEVELIEIGIEIYRHGDGDRDRHRDGDRHRDSDLLIQSQHMKANIINDNSTETKQKPNMLALGHPLRLMFCHPSHQPS